jgi:hypothetical protein
MKTLLPLERIRSVGRVHKLAAIIAAASVSCLPLSAFANHTSGGGGGGHPSGGGGHPSGGGHSGVGSSHPMASYYGGGSRSSYSGAGRSVSHNYHANLYTTTSRSHVDSHHETAATHHVASTAEHHDASVNRATNTSHTLTQTNKTDVARNTSRSSDPLHSPRAEALRANTSFDHSITTASAKGLMSQRLSQISNRQWTGHGAFCSDHFGNGCWFNHGGFFWRCNFWGANWYCNNLIGLGFAPGLCWAWYDDICWGNIVIGMPVDLVDYYYPDPVYSNYTTYDGDDATVYYYATDNGQYKQVTVVDGNVVDIEIVDQVS